MRLRRPSVGILLTLAGCIGPDYQRPPVMLPAQWQTEDEPRFDATNPVASEWWRAFNDPALNRVVEVAYRQNLPLQSAALRIEEARGQVGVARSRLFPQLQVVFGQVAVQRICQSAANVGQLDRNYV